MALLGLGGEGFRELGFRVLGFGDIYIYIHMCIHRMHFVFCYPIIHNTMFEALCVYF